MDPVEPSLTGVDRREVHRVHLHAEAEIEHAGDRQRCRVTDINADGMFLETDLALAVDQEFHAHIHAGEGAALEADCVVKRVVPTGVGVAFVEMTPADRVRLRKLLEALPH